MTTDRYRNEHAPQPPSFHKHDHPEIPKGAVLTTQETLAKQVRDLTRELKDARCALALAELPAPTAEKGPVRTHELKTWPVYYHHMVMGTKRFEIRRNDRGFQPGDHLILREFEPERQEYTGRRVTVEVLYMTADPTLCLPGFVVMSVRRCATRGALPCA